MPEVKAMVEGGKANAGPPIGPALAPLGVNIGAVVDEINVKTKSFAGMKVPVIITVDAASKTFEVEVGSPPTSALIMQEAKIKKGTGNPKEEFVGNLTLEQVKKVAEMKADNVNASTPDKAINEIIGTCDSMGVTIEGIRAKDFLAGRLGKAPARDLNKEEALANAPKPVIQKQKDDEDDDSSSPVVQPEQPVAEVKENPVEKVNDSSLQDVVKEVADQPGKDLEKVAEAAKDESTVTNSKQPIQEEASSLKEVADEVQEEPGKKLEEISHPEEKVKVGGLNKALDSALQEAKDEKKPQFEVKSDRASEIQRPKPKENK